MLINDYSERQKRSEETQRTILRWLLRELYSTSDIIASYLGYSRQGAWKALKRLESAALVRSVQLTVLNRSVITLWGLTAHGLGFAIESADELIKGQVFEPSRVATSMLAHHLDLQRARIRAERVGWTDWCRGERLGFQVPNRPDAVAKDTDGYLVAIELERTIKTVKRYRQIMAAHLKEIKQERWVRVEYVSPQAILVPRLERIFRSIDYVLISGQRVAVTEKHHARFRFSLLGGWP